jgi:hypothetical protein
MKTLHESILADIESSLDKGSEEIKKEFSVGNKLEIKSIYGDDTVMMNLLHSKLQKAVSGKEPYDKKKVDDVINQCERYFGGPMGLSKSIKEKIAMFITYIEHMPLDDIKIDFNKQKVKDEFCKELTDALKSKNIMLSGAEIHNRAGQAGGGDADGLFQLAIQEKQYMIIFLFKIKK